MNQQEMLQICLQYIVCVYIILKVPYCTPFWSFVLGFDVLKNIYLRYKYQKPSQYIFIAPLSEALLKTGRFVLSN